MENTKYTSPRISSLMRMYEKKTGAHRSWSYPASPREVRKIVGNKTPPQQQSPRFQKNLERELKRLADEQGLQKKKSSRTSGSGSRKHLRPSRVHASSSQQEAQIPRLWEVPVDTFVIPLANQKPNQVIRLFQEHQGNYRVLSICGERINVDQRLVFLERCYGLIHEHLGLRINSADLAWQLSTQIKENEQNDTPAHTVMAALTINHWANAWIHCLPSWCPKLFRSACNSDEGYGVRVAKGCGCPSGEYAVRIEKLTVTAIQRKRILVYRCDGTADKRQGVATLWVELHSSARTMKKKGPIDSEHWKGMVRVHAPLFELDAPDRDRKAIINILANVTDGKK